MNNLKVISLEGQLVTDSRDVSEMVGVEHKELLRTIRVYKEVLGKSNIALSDFFIESYYISSQNKKLPCYLLTKKGCSMVANKTTGERGILFTAAYVTEFEQMEEKLRTPYSLPGTFKEALLALVAKEEENEQLVVITKMYEQQIAEAAPKLTYVDEVLKCIDLMITSQIADDYGMSAIAFNKLLHTHGIQHKMNDQWLLYTKHKGNGYTKSETKEFRKTDGTTGVKLHTKWTQKGRLFLYELLKTKGILPTMEQLKFQLIENKKTG